MDMQLGEPLARVGELPERRRILRNRDARKLATEIGCIFRTVFLRKQQSVDVVEDVPVR
jgi:hypothetical protein